MSIINHDRSSPYWETQYIHSSSTKPSNYQRSRQSSPPVDQSSAHYSHHRPSPAPKTYYSTDTSSRGHLPKRRYSHRAPSRSASTRLERQDLGPATQWPNTTKLQDVLVTDHSPQFHPAYRAHYNHYNHISSPQPQPQLHQTSPQAIPVRRRISVTSNSSTSRYSSGHSSSNSNSPSSIFTNHINNRSSPHRYSKPAVQKSDPHITRKPLPPLLQVPQQQPNPISASIPHSHTPPNRQSSVLRRSPKHVEPDWRIADQKGQYDHLFLRSPLSDSTMYSKPQLSGRGAQGSHVRFESNTPHYSKSTPLCTQFSEINSVSHVLRNTLITPRPRDQMNQIPVQKRAQRRQSFSKAMSKPLPNRPTLRRSVSSDAQIPTVNTTAINRPVGTITNTNVNINTNPSTSISSSTNNSISTTAINNTDINGNSNSNGNGNENANANFNGNVNFNTTTPSQKEIINSLLDNERVPEPDSPVRPPNFWNPRQEGQGLSTQKLSHQWRSLWKPRRTLLEQTSEDQFTHDRLQSLERTRTPSIQQDSGVVDPFLLLQNTLEVADTRELQFLDTEFNQIDTYATNVNQRGQMVTPQLLAQKFLARPYRRDLHKVRSIFIWLVQNIAIQETETWTDETAEQVLAKRSCTSSFGLAALFCEMARAAGINDTQVICGYCRGPKDTLKDAFEDGYLVQNHAWCSIKVEGEYRMVDCWLASPNHPLNEGVESHWFLTTPLSMIHTHLPSDDRDQYLDPPLYLSSFLSLPHVWIPFFSHHIQVVDFDPSTLTLVDNQTYHLTIRMDPDTACCVQVECQDGTLVRGLAQLEPSSNHRTYKIKAVLPLDTHAGWLQVYCGPRSTFVAEQQTSPYSLAMSFPLKHTGKTRAFEFVKLHPNHEEFFIDEPQCYQIYPRQPYSFRIIKDDSRHPKMAIKSPTGKIFKLLYTPQDHSYTGNITVTEIGQWTLVCLYHHAERWQTVANWECRI